MIELAPPAVHAREVVADPTPMGLLGLAVGCAALTPIAFGASLSPAGLETAAMYCLLFGAGCQFLAGMLNFVNRNLYGATLFLTFAFNWVFNWWVLHRLARGVVADAGVVFATEVAFLAIFVLITWGFGHFSSLLFVFLLDIDLVYLGKVLNSILHTRAFDLPIAILTVGLGALSLWIAFALLLNPVTGRQVFALGSPVFRSKVRPAPQFGVRRAVISALYGRWMEGGDVGIPVTEIERALATVAGDQIRRELGFLAGRGVVVLDGGGVQGPSASLTAAGVDCWERFLHGKAS